MREMSPLLTYRPRPSRRPLRGLLRMRTIERDTKSMPRTRWDHFLILRSKRSLRLEGRGNGLRKTPRSALLRALAVVGAEAGTIDLVVDELAQGFVAALLGVAVAQGIGLG